MVKAGTQPGVISCNLDEAFAKISQKFEQTPSAKIFIPGQAPIEVPVVDFNAEPSSAKYVSFEASVMLNLNNETMAAL